MALYEFDATKFNPAFAGGSQLTPGKHPVMIIETELVPMKMQKGGVKLIIEAIDGPAKGTTQQVYLMTYSPDKADEGIVESNQKRLSAICYVTGVYKFKDTNELCKRPFVVEVAPQKKNPEFMEVVEVFTSDMRKASEVLQSGNAPTQAPVIPAQTAPSEPASSAPEPTAAWGGAPAQTAPAPAWGASANGNGGSPPWG